MSLEVSKALGPILWALFFVLMPTVACIYFLTQGVWVGVVSMLTMLAIGLKVTLGTDRKFWKSLL